MTLTNRALPGGRPGTTRETIGRRYASPPLPSASLRAPANVAAPLAASLPPLDIVLRGEVGSATFNAAGLAAQLQAAAGRPVRLLINSNGGDVLEGARMVQLLNRYRGPITTQVETRAASMAAVIFMTGDRRVIGPHAEVVPHEVHRALPDGTTVSAAECYLAAAAHRDLPLEARRRAARICDELREATRELAALADRLVGGTTEVWQDRMASEQPFTGRGALYHNIATEELS